MVFRESAVMYNEELDSVAHKIDVARLIARKLAHQWIHVTPSWWSYAWINEGISTLFGMEAINKVSCFLKFFLALFCL